MERFDGDGSGLTSRKNIDWQLNEDITFYVKGQYDGVCNICFYYSSFLVPQYHDKIKEYFEVICFITFRRWE